MRSWVGKFYFALFRSHFGTLLQATEEHYQSGRPPLALYGTLGFLAQWYHTLKTVMQPKYVMKDLYLGLATSYVCGVCLARGYKWLPCTNYVIQQAGQEVDALLVPPPDMCNVITPYMVIQRVLNELCANTNVPSVTDVWLLHCTKQCLGCR